MKKIILIFILFLLFIYFKGNNIWMNESSQQNIADGVLYGDTVVYHSISGQVLYKDNNQPVQWGYVKALKYDRENDDIITVDSTVINPSDGLYVLPKCTSDSLYIMAYGDDEMDLIPGYYDTTISWRSSKPICSKTNLNNVNIKVNRIIKQENGVNDISGNIFKSPHIPLETLKDAIIYVKYGAKYKGFGITHPDGNYLIDSLPPGNIEIIVDRIGYYSDYRFIQIGQFNTDTINFYLIRIASVNNPNQNYPIEFKLYQSYPNPFNPVTVIKFDIPPVEVIREIPVKLAIYDILGKEIAILVNGSLKPGTYKISWDAANYPSGVYFYKLSTAYFAETKKLVLIK